MKVGALLLAAVPAFAQYALYVCGPSTQNYVVGAKLPASGIFVRSAKGEWTHAGFNHPFITAFDYDATDASVVYAAAGNGLLRVTENGERWKILTGQRCHRTARRRGGSPSSPERFTSRTPPESK